MGLSSYRLNASIAVTDVTRAEEFYEGKLGLSAVRTGADGSKVYASAGDESLEVYPSPDHAGRSTATLATWHVDHVEQMVDELTSTACLRAIRRRAQAASITARTRRDLPRAGGGKVAWFKDPDGNIFSIEGDR